MRIIRNVNLGLNSGEVIFSDVNPLVVDASPNEFIYNEEALIQSLITIFDTPVKSRPFRRTFGTMLERLLFDPIGVSTAQALSLNMRQAVEQWESRISNFEASVIPDYELQGYYVECTFTVPALNDKTVNFNFNLVNNSDSGS